MKRKKKTSSELIVDALRTGGKLRLSEITELMSQYSGTDIKIQNVSSTMAKLSDGEKTEIGHFISRQKTKQGYVYKLADEALALTAEQTYGLIRKVDKDRFTIKDAIEEVPTLKKYIRGYGAKKTIRRTANRKANAQAFQAETAEAMVEAPTVEAPVAEKASAPRSSRNIKPTVEFAVGNTEIGNTEEMVQNAPIIEQLTKILQQFTNGNVNVTLNINVRFSGFE